MQVRVRPMLSWVCISGSRRPEEQRCGVDPHDGEATFYSLSEPSLKDPRYRRWGYRHARSPRSLAGDDCPVPPPSPPVQHLPPGQRPQTVHSPAAQSPVTSQTALVRPTPRTLLFASPSAARAAGAPSPGWGDGGGGGTGAMSEGIVFPGTCVSLPADTLALTQPFTPRPLEP